MSGRVFSGRRQAGVTLIEALVAMAVMAFGMLALLGLQGTLRGNSDVSKQRAEAVRLAQEKLEERRAFSVLDTVTGRKAFADIQIETPTPASWSGYESSTTFNREVQVVNSPVGTTSDLDKYYTAARKSVSTSVSWLDRNNERQEVTLRTIVARIAPEVVGALSVTAINAAQQRPGGRHPTIPPGAVNMPTDSSKSVFNPGAAAGVYWKFDNNTGYIVGICPDMTGTACVTVDKRLLWGHIRYSLGSVRPTSQQAETPTDYSLIGYRIGVVVHQPAYPVAAPTICLMDPSTASLGAYYCLMSFDVPIPQTTPPTIGVNWSGRSVVTINGCWDNTRHNDAPLLPADTPSPYRCEVADTVWLASSASDVSPSHFRICRYTTRRDHAAVDADPPLIRNADHPLNYVAVTQSLSNQNFLVIRAGDGYSAFPCPDDDSATPLYGRTYAHQPTTQVAGP